MSGAGVAGFHARLILSANPAPAETAARERLRWTSRPRWGPRPEPGASPANGRRPIDTRVPETSGSRHASASCAAPMSHSEAGASAATGQAPGLPGRRPRCRRAPLARAIDLDHVARSEAGRARASSSASSSAARSSAGGTSVDQFACSSSSFGSLTRRSASSNSLQRQPSRIAGSGRARRGFVPRGAWPPLGDIARSRRTGSWPGSECSAAFARKRHPWREQLRSSTARETSLERRADSARRTAPRSGLSCTSKNKASTPTAAAARAREATRLSLASRARATLTPRQLDRMRGVEAHGHRPDERMRGEAAKIDNQVVVAEARAALGEHHRWRCPWRLSLSRISAATSHGARNCPFFTLTARPVRPAATSMSVCRERNAGT